MDEVVVMKPAGRAGRAAAVGGPRLVLSEEGATREGVNRGEVMRHLTCLIEARTLRRACGASQQIIKALIIFFRRRQEDEIVRNIANRPRAARALGHLESSEER